MRFLKRQKMSVAEQQFYHIVDVLTEEFADVTQGPMMSAPGLKCNGKVFAFLYKGEMGFKLGKQTDPAGLGISDYKPLSPFKTKGPLPGWFVVGTKEISHWENLARFALKQMLG